MDEPTSEWHVEFTLGSSLDALHGAGKWCFTKIMRARYHCIPKDGKDINEHSRAIGCGIFFVSLSMHLMLQSLREFLFVSAINMQKLSLGSIDI